MRLLSDTRLKLLKHQLGLHTTSGIFVLISSIVTWATMMVLVVTGVYNATLMHVFTFTLKMLFMYLFISITSTCVKFGGCNRYHQLLTLSSISISVIFVMTI